MNIKVQLVRKGWVVASRGNVTAQVRGQAHLGDEYLDSRALAERFASVACSRNELPEFVKRLNGNWAAVVQSPDSFFLSVDHIRSIQLLYAKLDDGFCVFDDMEEFRKDHAVEFLEGSVQEYLSSGFVYGNGTLFKDVFSLQAGECVAVDAAGTVEPKRYYRFHALPSEKSLPADLDKRADEVFLRTFRRTLQVVGEKRIAVPLSGGCDSRLIVNYLHRLGVKNVVTFSYGFPNNREAVIAKQVAAGLGYPWHFVEYDKGLREREIYDYNDAPHNRFMCNGVNRPCKQDFHAIKELLARGIIHEGDVIMPGYCFDVVAGSFLQRNLHHWSIVAELHGHDADFWNEGAWRLVNRRIKRVMDQNQDIAWSLFWETFLWQERLVKFVINNIRTYDNLNLSWSLPLWDTELVDFWMHLPDEMRMERRYFYRVLPNLCEPEIRNISYYNIHASSTESIFHRLVTSIRERTPNLVKHYLRETRSLVGLKPAAMPDENPQSGAVSLRREERDRLVATFPSWKLGKRLVHSHGNRGAIEAMVSLLQMVENDGV